MIDTREMDAVGVFEAQNPRHVDLTRVDHGSRADTGHPPVWPHPTIGPTAGYDGSPRADDPSL